MIQSMTGYGKVVVAFKDKKISAEIKSLNSKQLDLQTRIAPLYREKEMEIRQMIAASLERGKVDFSLWIEKDASVDATPVNAALVENYYHQLKDVAQKVGIPEPEDWMYTLTRMPDVLSKTEQEELSDEEWAAARKAVDDGCEACRGEQQPAGHRHHDNHQSQQRPQRDECDFPTFLHCRANVVELP